MICSACQRESVSGIRAEDGRLYCPVCYPAEGEFTPSAGPALPPLWPHQSRGIAGARRAIARGARAVVLAAPTGAGKTRMAAELAASAVAKGKRAAVFTNRRILLSQMAAALRAKGVPFGVVAEGHEPDSAAPVQLCSFQTVDARVFRAGRGQLPGADLVIVDEAHSNKAETGRRVIGHYRGAGAVVVGLSATPVGLARLYDDLVHAGCNSELRAAGVLVPCVVFAPEEPDMTGVKRQANGEFESKEMRRRASWIVKGRIFDEWARVNPGRKATIVFAPGVRESQWLAREYWPKRGVTAAHIDGTTPEAERERIFAASKAGEITVICSCGVLREGADLPWVEVAILLQVCGRLSTFLQLVGRVLRAHPGKTRAVLLDFSGAWHRHGDPNDDQTWTLDGTDRKAARARRQALKRGEAREDVRCPKCGGTRKGGPRCPHCGHEHVRSVRAVRMEDGRLIKKVGSVVKRDRVTAEAERAWQSCLYAAARAKRPMTVRQAAANYYRKTGKWPDGLPGVPNRGSTDWGRLVVDAYPRTAPKGRATT